MVERQIAVAGALAPAVEAVVANHVDTDTPVVVEGDYVLPGLARPGGLVRAVFPVLAPRPWADLVGRVVEAVRAPAGGSSAPAPGPPASVDLAQAPAAP
ncbi:hypothetical protein CF54_21115 [Streptomyces sp. Tu 6176]|uniref:hypothetical protein n=1 Tax=Streptomyces sp. Tu 6176 TaxID=1470557 RepID=UPI00044EE1AA|nr:hypothetical protein [Streptomyces sp. Tu 6176]EYT81165.1 hypothetical protein CF54_21115 [Streptomyces sp. Tu 6176]